MWVANGREVSIIPYNRTFRREGAKKVGRGTGGVFRTGPGRGDVW